MGIAKFKGAFEGLSFLKSYSSLLWPVIISLAAVLFLVLSPLMGSRLEKRIATESVLTGRRVKSLSRDTISGKQSQVEKKYQDAYENDANQIAVLVKQSSRRQLLSYKIFPEPKDTSALIFDEFRQRFRDGLDALMDKVNANDCPTDTELERAISSSNASNSRTRRRRGESMFRGRRSSSRLSGVDEMIVAELCREKAESARVYANSTDLSGYEFWRNYEYVGMDKAVEDCWYWQLGYWIIEDVIDTIDVMNSGSQNVLTLPVKRLMIVNFVKSRIGGFGSRSRFRRRRSGSRTSVRGDKPDYVRSINDGFTEPCTGRFCDNDIDIVHFNLSVLLRTKDIPLFMQQLCSAKQHKFKGFLGNEPEQTSTHNQITILEYDTGPIDRESSEHKLYQYGENAVVKLDLICEYIFDKNGYDEIKPKVVKDSLKKP
ncbi:MAG: hypothetical protein ACYS1A_00725 [Planctomycetota bacterium]|jgi:hypothetical protein